MPEDDFYDSPEESEPKSESMDEGEDDQKTFLAPKSAFGGHKCKVGDVYKFKVVHVYEDEAELEYMPKGKDDEDSEDKPERGGMMREAESRMGELTE